MTVDLLDALARHYDPAPPARLGVAVSGGGDSVALLCLLAAFSKEHGITVLCATVDHGLRSGSAAEAKSVAALCAELGIEHETLEWRDWDGIGNTQNAARDGRYRLLADWARSHELAEVALGHTLDDQAETVLMRMARAAGVDGLSAMPARRSKDGISFGRPLLSVSRAELRDYLRQIGVSWIDDPTNDDAAYDRIKARQILAHLAPLGIDAGTLGQVAQNMQRTRAGLEDITRSVAAKIASCQLGALRVTWSMFRTQPDEIQRRLLLAAIGTISPSEYPPRSRSVQSVLETLAANTSATLNGCLMLRKKDALWVCREYKAVEATTAQIGEVWDARWSVNGPKDAKGYLVSALGPKGLNTCANWRDLGVPREVLMVTPAVWKDAKLVAAPLVNRTDTWQAVPQHRRGSLLDGLFSH